MKFWILFKPSVLTGFIYSVLAEPLPPSLPLFLPSCLLPSLFSFIPSFLLFYLLYLVPQGTLKWIELGP